MKHLPQARTGNLVVQNLENEVLIFDLTENKAFCLNETSGLVYHACDGQTDFEDFKNKYKFTDEVIFLALDLLKKESLLEESFVSPLAGLKRREVIKKIGLTSVIALPIISSLLAPTSAMAAASCGGTLPPNTVLGCVPTEQNCLNMFQMCASCATTAAIVLVEPGMSGCDPATPYFCTCL